MGSDEGNGRHIPQLGVVFLVGNDGSGKTMLSTSLSLDSALVWSTQAT